DVPESALELRGEALRREPPGAVRRDLAGDAEETAACRRQHAVGEAARRPQRLRVDRHGDGRPATARGRARRAGTAQARHASRPPPSTTSAWPLTPLASGWQSETTR